MGNTNSTNQKIKDFFNNSKIKDVFGKIGGVFGKFISFGETMLTNMIKMSTNLSNFMGTSYFPYILIGGVLIFVGIRTKMI